MTQLKKSTRVRGSIFGDRRTISLRLSIELHERLLAHVDGKSTVNQFLVNLIESGLVKSTQLSRAKVPQSSPGVVGAGESGLVKMGQLSRAKVANKLPDEKYCHSCGIGFLVADTRDWVYRWEEYETVIPSVSGMFCPACGDVFTQGEHKSRLEGMQTEFRQKMVRERQLRS
jgi:YgiT-type zinc finger domain-containing protein